MKERVTYLSFTFILMPTCGECIYAEDPSPTLVRCRLKGIFRYLDDPSCEDFKPFKDKKP